MKFEELTSKNPQKNNHSVIFVRTTEEKETVINLLSEVEKIDELDNPENITLSNGVITPLEDMNKWDAHYIPDNKDRLDSFIKVWDGDIGDPEWWEDFHKWEPKVTALEELFAPIQIKVLSLRRKTTWV